MGVDSTSYTYYHAYSSEKDCDVGDLGVGPNNEGIVMDRLVEDADSTNWVVPLITICLASCDERRTAPMRYFRIRLGQRLQQSIS